jgi:hypothetical protein
MGLSDSDTGNLYNGLNATTINTNDVLIKQKDMIQIIDNENNRLQEKKQNVDNALEGQQRLITLNNSYRLRYADYIKILIIITISISIYVFVSLARKYIPFFPEVIYNITLILLIPITIIVLYYKYIELISHNKLYYDELEFTPPKMLSEEDKLKEKVAYKTNLLKSGDILGGLEGCVGAQCCSGNTIWDSGNSVCVVKPNNGFTTIDYALLNGEINFKLNNNTNDGIKPNSPSEFDSYTKI